MPLTVSPFVNLPSATTLPYTYKPMPSTLPPSALGIAAADGAKPDDDSAGDAAKPKYVVSPSGHAAHPDEILASCRALHAHVAQLQARAEQELAALEERIRARELAEKRRVAPGWLDSDARLLEPERKGPSPAAGRAAAAGAGNGNGAGNGGDGGGGGGYGDDDDDGVRRQQLQQQQEQVQFQAGQQQFGADGAGNGSRYGDHGCHQTGLGPGGPISEMAVPDAGEQLDRAFGSLQLGDKS